MTTLTTAMILAAGRGERMRPLTDSLPKPLIPVAGKPLIEHHLLNLAAAGIRKVVINHAWLGQQIVDALGQGERFGLDIIYSPENPALETAGGIIQALPKLACDAFLVVNGDVWCDIDFKQIRAPEAGALANLVMVDNPKHHPKGDFALIDGVLHRQQRRCFTFSGIATYRSECFAGLPVQNRPLREVLWQQIDAGRVSGQYHGGRWCDVGTPERLSQLNRQLQVAEMH